MLKLTVPFTPVKLPLESTLLNQMNRPAGIELELKLEVIAPLITQ
jgi:hypothetical protein